MQDQANADRQRLRDQLEGEREMGAIKGPDGGYIDEATGEILPDGREIAAKAATNESDLLALIEEPDPIPWVADEPGDRIAGTVVNHEQMEDDYGRTIEVVDVRIASGELLQVRSYGEAFTSQMVRKNPQPGDRMAVEYKGIVDSKVKGHQGYKLFKIVVIKASASDS